MYRFTNMIQALEENIHNELDVAALAKMVGLSVYEFRRVFTFVAGMSLGEYVRKRRLSLAAVELFKKNTNISCLAMECGYDSPSSFSRAFKEFHGVSPTQAAQTGAFRTMTRLDVQILAVGGKDISCTMRQLPDFWVHGMQGISSLTDTECCEAVWRDFYESNCCQLPGDTLYAVFENDDSSVRCTIGAQQDSMHAVDKVYVPEGLWACFTMHTTEDGAVNSFYNRLLQQWLSSMPYVRREDAPNVEVYPMDMETDGFAWEIRIPVREKE